ncbi:uncharacterized protein LOC111371825 [Olea europaea var. sylvestris]|uniref:uncharacterized protein LOC111371825 n=1 Tax=Olea europaea var. sylvestris TaxID=158386 RepID=UPI000C1CCCB2|nr:uncharacterized protein LOC111371825 [Olea europaea var. sylvestris]
MVNRVILTPTNECVDYINRLLLEKIPSQSFTYYSFDEAIEKLEQSLQEDFLNTLTPNGILPHELKLKMNCHVLLLRNINHSEGLCNGTRLTCRKFERNVILAEITIGEYRGKQITSIIVASFVDKSCIYFCILFRFIFIQLSKLKLFKMEFGADLLCEDVYFPV